MYIRLIDPRGTAKPRAKRWKLLTRPVETSRATQEPVAPVLPEEKRKFKRLWDNIIWSSLSNRLLPHVCCCQLVHRIFQIGVQVRTSLRWNCSPTDLANSWKASIAFTKSHFCMSYAPTLHHIQLVHQCLHCTRPHIERNTTTTPSEIIKFSAKSSILGPPLFFQQIGVCSSVHLHCVFRSISEL